VGGTRTISLSILADNNEFNQLSEVQTKPSASSSVPSALIFSPGYKVFGALELGYGLTDAGVPPLNLNLTQYDRLRFYFDGLSNGLNFNVEANYGSSYFDCGINIFGPYYSPFTVDFPFSQFTPGSAADWSTIEYIIAEFQQADGPLSQMAITNIEAILGTDTTLYPPATFSCTALPAS